MKLAAVSAIADMVVPVVLITTGVLMANGLLLHVAVVGIAMALVHNSETVAA